MRNHTITCYRLTGTLGDHTKQWSCTSLYESPDTSLARSHGTLYVVMDITASHKTDMALAGKLTKDVLTESYFASPADGTPMHRLEQAVIASKERLRDVAFGVTHTSSTHSLDLNVVAAVVWENVLYVARLGSVVAAVVRDGQVEEIGAGYENTVTVSSGVMHAGDVFVFGSRFFSESISLPVLPKSVPVLMHAARLLEPADGAGTDDVSMSNAYPIGFSAVLLAVEETQASESSSEEAPNVEAVSVDVGTVEELSEQIAPVVVKPLIRVKVRREVFLNNLRSLRSRFTRVGAYVSRQPQSLYIRREEVPLVDHSRSSRWIGIGTLLLAGLFVVTVYFTISTKRNRVHSEQVAAHLTKAREDLNKAHSLVDLNNSRAREFLRSSASAVADAEALLSSPSSDSEALTEEIKKLSDQVNKVERVSDPHVFYDVKIADQNALPVALVGSSTSLYVVEGNEGKVYRLRRDQGAVPSPDVVVTQEVLKTTRSILAGSGGIFLAHADGFSRVNIENGTFTNTSLSMPSGWNSIVDVEGYADALYFLAEDGQIFRTFVDGTSFSDVVSWLGDTSYSAGAATLTVDGDIYVAKKTGEVVKFNKGTIQDWRIVDLETPLSEVAEMYTTPDSNFLYILDKGNRRVVVVVKEGGLYQRQVVYSGDDEQAWSDLRDLWVDEDSSTVYLLDGSRIYDVKLP